MSELKPCPFCGGSARLIEPDFSKHDADCEDFEIRCEGGCEINMSRMALRDYGLDELSHVLDALVDTWNYRAAPESCDELSTVAWRFRHSPEEKWYFDEAPQNWWEKQQLVERDEAEKAIMAARAERDDARKAEEAAKDCFWSIYETYLEKGGIPVSTEGARSALANRLSALQSDNAALTYRTSQIAEEVATLSAKADGRAGRTVTKAMVQSVHDELYKIGMGSIKPNDLRSILTVALPHLSAE